MAIATSAPRESERDEGLLHLLRASRRKAGGGQSRDLDAASESLAVRSGPNRLRMLRLLRFLESGRQTRQLDSNLLRRKQSSTRRRRWKIGSRPPTTHRA
jgi:hypothetical protein